MREKRRQELLKKGKEEVLPLIEFNSEIEKVLPGTEDKVIEHLMDAVIIQQQAKEAMEDALKYLLALEELKVIKEGATEAIASKIADEDLMELLNAIGKKETTIKSEKVTTMAPDFDLDEKEFIEDIDRQLAEKDITDRAKKDIRESLIKMHEKHRSNEEVAKEFFESKEEDKTENS